MLSNIILFNRDQLEMITFSSTGAAEPFGS